MGRGRTRNDRRIEKEQRRAARVARTISLFFPRLAAQIARFPTQESRGHALVAIARLTTRGAIWVTEFVSAAISFLLLMLVLRYVSGELPTTLAYVVTLLTSLVIGWWLTLPLLLWLRRGRIAQLVASRLKHEGVE